MLRSSETGEKSSQRQLTPMAAAGSALATLVCCLPTCFGAAAATAGVTLVLGTAQPWLLGASIVLLGVAWCEVYAARDTCMKRRRTTLALLWFSAVVVTLMVADWLT